MEFDFEVIAEVLIVISGRGLVCRIQFNDCRRANIGTCMVSHSLSYGVSGLLFVWDTVTGELVLLDCLRQNPRRMLRLTTLSAPMIEYLPILTSSKIMHLKVIHATFSLIMGFAITTR